MGSTLAIYPAQNVKLVQFQQSLIRRHIDYLVEAILEVNERKHKLRGVKIVEGPPFMRHFTARFQRTVPSR